VGSVKEELTQVDVMRSADLSVQRVTGEQWKEFGDVKYMVGEYSRFPVGEDNLSNRVFAKTDNRTVVPKTFRTAVLQLLHGSRRVGYCFFGTAARLRKRFWLARWYAAVEKKVTDCPACRLSKMKRSRRQAQMKV
jgi:Integrase zinc binding domain